MKNNKKYCLNTRCSDCAKYNKCVENFKESMAKQNKGKKMKKEKVIQVPEKMYVIVRNDLSVAYRCVQGAHALSQYAMELNESFSVWDNQYLIFLSTPNLITLKEFVKQLKKQNVVYSSFKEPDLGNQITAIAFRAADMPEDIAELVSQMPLTY